MSCLLVYTPNNDKDCETGEISPEELREPTEKDILNHLYKRLGIDPSVAEKHFPECSASRVVDGLCASLLEEVVMSYAHSLQDSFGDDLRPEHWKTLPEPVKTQMTATWGKYGNKPLSDPLTARLLDGWPVYDRIIDHASELDEIGGRPIVALGLGSAALPAPA